MWRLDEDVHRLLALCREREIPCEDLAGLPLKRQRECAAERLLLCHAMGQPVRCAHDVHGAPLIEDVEVNVSITHTPRLVAVAISDDTVIGIDAEQEDRHQVLRVRDKFLNASEKQFIDADDLMAHVIAWTAKEAIIKAERNSALDWTDGITLEPFAHMGEEDAMILRATCGNRHYTLECRQLEGHRITVSRPVNA